MQDENLTGSDAPREGEGEPKGKRKQKGDNPKKGARAWKFINRVFDAVVQFVLPAVFPPRK